MGTFFQTIEIAASPNGHFESIEALVAAGASYTWFPSSILSRLNLVPLFKRWFTLADGTTIERDVTQIVVRLGEQALFTICILGDDGSIPLLGAVTLEEFGLGVDPVNKRLIPIPGFLV
ncbi:MAG: hypothetical protein COS88_00300 [Chloroflexi bacterium CG07_land_8_20_14_0_80_51_10]|nr:MAG: hypothetical protein COS88_00300 [Chloroflexi bacterium CG07_land_8_20_14_0_80_51_10]